MSYALEQPEWLRSSARSTKSLHHFAWNPLYYVVSSFIFYNDYYVENIDKINISGSVVIQLLDGGGQVFF